MTPCYSYPIDVHEERDGGFSITFPDFDEAFTDGDTWAEAIEEAADCLEKLSRVASRAGKRSRNRVRPVAVSR